MFSGKQKLESKEKAAIKSSNRESKVCTYKETWGNNVGYTPKPAA